ncbi:hypothetical protein PN36_10910 [Candidatus Thiomargarita nelsonii]|uniref:SpoVT-AbrB domain-containing protein n=1 Tax=Candidatus Thiomargarita nelsonii TaxID=1003181 RepID=A0A0A6PB46_9GAMM|nr:hypothetical protein PN36_10910 [Candidatus Thiomargarita nelsonii]
MNTTKDSLGIFWLIEKPQPDGRIERFHEEVDGFTVNALWNQELPETLIDEIYNQLNQLLSEKAMPVKISPIFSDEYKNLCIDFRVIEWPQNWLPLLNKILKLPVNLGAIVSYVGIEGSFSWPFDPVEMENTVYAAYCQEMGFICHANLDEEIQYLSNKELNRLKRYMVSYARQNNHNSSMADTTLLPNFQVLIPNNVLEQLHLQVGQQFICVTENRTIRLIPKSVQGAYCAQINSKNYSG